MCVGGNHFWKAEKYCLAEILVWLCSRNVIWNSKTPSQTHVSFQTKGVKNENHKRLAGGSWPGSGQGKTFNNAWRKKKGKEVSFPVSLIIWGVPRSKKGTAPRKAGLRRYRTHSLAQPPLPGPKLRPSGSLAHQNTTQEESHTIWRSEWNT